MASFLKNISSALQMDVTMIFVMRSPVVPNNGNDANQNDFLVYTNWLCIALQS